MDREEILAQSRAENREQDVFEREVLREGGNAGAMVSSLLALALCTVRMLFGRGMDFGLWAVITASLAASFSVKASRLHRRHEMLVAAGYGALALALSAAYIYEIAAGGTHP